jgi:FAD/FMN-containing dehydrogenase
MPASIFSRFTALENFGHSLRAPSYLLAPKSEEDIAEALDLARRMNLRIALRGAGRSYNDAALNGGGILLDMSGMNRILEWNPETGIVRAEPGVSLRQLWQHVLPDGWWPPVVSGTMFTTLGGCLGMNVHGKNNYQEGTFGEHVLSFTALLPNGERVVCTPTQESDLFHAMISGMGMLGIFVEVTLQLKRVSSGMVEVHAWNVPDLDAHLCAVDGGARQYDYIVGWLDSTARGRALGRGQIHAATYLPAEKVPNANETLQTAYQTLPSRFFGIVPKSLLQYAMRPFLNNWGVTAVNTAKYLLGRTQTYPQSHAAFHFLLDYIPDWERAYGREGLIQHQSFLPLDTASDAWKEMLSITHRRGLVSYLGVVKRHRPDSFLLTHAVDGFSLALDFKVTRGNRADLAAMLADFDEIVLDAGGRFYFAKNSETSPETARRFLGEETLEKFRALKERCDPQNLLQSDLYRRVFLG